MQEWARGSGLSHCAMHYGGGRCLNAKDMTALPERGTQKLSHSEHTEILRLNMQSHKVLCLDQTWKEEHVCTSTG